LFYGNFRRQLQDRNFALSFARRSAFDFYEFAAA